MNKRPEIILYSCDRTPHFVHVKHNLDPVNIINGMLSISFYLIINVVCSLSMLCVCVPGQCDI